jgi:fatty-acid desaturase
VHNPHHEQTTLREKPSEEHRSSWFVTVFGAFFEITQARKQIVASQRLQDTTAP